MSGYGGGGQQTPEQAAAHAAAWAAYYQSQGAQAPSAYNAPAQAPSYGQPPLPAGPPPPVQGGPHGPGGGSNPYANYGYGAGAQHTPRPPNSAQSHGPAHSHAQGYVPPQQHGAGPSAYNYAQGNAAGYGGDQAAYAGQPGPQAYPGGQQSGYGGYQPPASGPQGGQGQFGGAYGPGAGQQQAGYRPPAAHQPYQPQPQPSSYVAGNASSPYSNNGTPGPPGPAGPRPARPFGPGHAGQNGFPRAPSNPPGPHGGPGSGPQGRPPMNTGPFPPAKRPRFDAPGGPGGVQAGAGMNSPMHTNQMQNHNPNLPRPPVSHATARPPLPMNAAMRPPLRPQLPGPVAGAAPPARPPIRLGLGGPPPNLPFAPRGPGASGAASSMRGAPAGPSGRGGAVGRGGVPGAPRGPAGRGGMRMGDRRSAGAGPLAAGGGAGGLNAQNARDRERDKDREERRRKDREQRELESKDGGRRDKGSDRDRDRERDRDRDKDREARKDKMTMTDWRIVGIEIKGLMGLEEGWRWGVTGEDAGWKTDEAAAEAQALVQGTQGQSKEEEEDVEVKQEEEEDQDATDKATGGTSEIPTGAVGEQAGFEREVKQEHVDVPAALDSAEMIGETPAGEGAERSPLSGSAAAAEAEEARRRGEKRKANSPDGEREPDGGASKKRPSTATTLTAPASAPDPTSVSPSKSGPDVSASTMASEMSYTKSDGVKAEPAELSESAKPDSAPASSGLPPKPLPTAIVPGPAPPVGGSGSGVGGASSIYDSNSNRLRIYFESAPELDRIPKSLRRVAAVPSTSVNAAAVGGAGSGGKANVNGKRGRESSSVAPSLVPGVEQKEEREEEEQEAQDGHVEPEAEAEAEVEVHGEVLQEGQEADAVTAADKDEESQELPAETGEHLEAEADQHAEVEVEAEHPGLDLAAAEHLESTDAEPTDPGPDEQAVKTADESAAEETNAGDVSMRTDGAGDVLDQQDVVTDTQGLADSDPALGIDIAAGADASAEAADAESSKIESSNDPTAAAAARAAELAATLAQSATNMASAYGSRRPARETSTSAFSAADSTAQTHLDEADHHDEAENQEEISAGEGEGPSKNRLTILYEGSGRRLCLDAEIVERVNIHRADGRIEVLLKPSVTAEVGLDGATGIEGEHAAAEEDEEDQGIEDDADPEPEPEPEVKVEEDGSEKEKEKPRPQLPKGILVEVYDTTDQRFVSLNHAQLGSDPWSVDQTVPPFHLAYPTPSPSSRTDFVSTNDADPNSDPEHENGPSGPTVTVYLNKKRPLSESKWCRTDRADEWLTDQFGASFSSRPGSWKGKLFVLDPDAGPTIQSILDSWAGTSPSGTPASRRQFVGSLLANPNDLLEILLRLTRGERNTPVPPTTSSGGSHAVINAGQNGQGGQAGPGGPAALAQSIRLDSPYASHQTHVSLAILAMYRLTTDYAAKAGVSEEGVLEKVGDIIRSLPGKMIEKSLEGMWKEWNAEEGKKRAVKSGMGRAGK